MARGYAALCVLLLQATFIQAAPAESTQLKPRSSLGLVDKHIVGGEYVDIKEVPYQLSLQVFWLHTCGAAIVSTDYALTAGHCNIGVDFITKYTVWLVAGSTTVPFTLAKKHFLEQSWTHPQFQFQTLDNDVGVIKVRDPFQFSETTQPLPLPPVDSEEEFLDFTQKATISGWGVTGAGGVFPTVWLKKGDIALVQRQECEEAYRKAYLKVTPRMICAGGYERGDSCQGDSGGPLAHKGHLIGLVSWGIGCNNPSYPGVYANLFNPDIRSFVNKHSGL